MGVGGAGVIPLVGFGGSYSLVCLLGVGAGVTGIVGEGFFVGRCQGLNFGVVSSRTVFIPSFVAWCFFFIRIISLRFR